MKAKSQSVSISAQDTAFNRVKCQKYNACSYASLQPPNIQGAEPSISKAGPLMIKTHILQS